MTERLNKRGFLKRVGLVGGVMAVAGVDEAYGNRIFQEKHDLNPDVMTTLGLQADIIAPYVSFRGFELSRDKGASAYKIIPKPRVVAQMLLAMAYYEEGQEGVGKTMKAISQKGLEIVLDQTISPQVEGEVINPLIRPNKPYQIIFAPKYLLNTGPVLQHEIYHVHQSIRDGDVKSTLINWLVTSGSLILFYILIDDLLNESKANYSNIMINNPVDHSEKEVLGRRRFLEKTIDKTIKWGAAFGLFVQFSQFLIPDENQAHAQTDGNPNTLVADPYFKFDSLNLFDFEKVQ